MPNQITVEELLTIMENTPVGICITDENGIFQRVNRAYCDFYGYKEEELLGKHFSLVVPEEYRAELTILHDRFIAGHNEMRGEWKVRKRNGAISTILADAAFIIGADGRPRKATFVVDITDRQRFEELREEVERITRHDLKSPLSGIISLSQIFQLDDNLTEEQRERAAMIEQAGRRLIKMINLSTNLWQLESGSYTFAPESVDLIRLLDIVILEHSRQANSIGSEIMLFYQGERLRLEPKAKRPECLVEGEELLLYSLFHNLLQNAIEATPQQRTIEVRIYTGSQRITTEIQNHGDVPEEIRDRFFDKYVTLGKRSGSGLGTYSAKMFAELHSGRIDLETGSGTTTLKVVLPLVAPVEKCEVRKL